MDKQKPKKLFKVASEFNVATQSIVDTLSEYGFDVINRPNSSITQEMYDLLEGVYSDDYQIAPKERVNISSKEFYEVIKSANSSDINHISNQSIQRMTLYLVTVLGANKETAKDCAQQAFGKVYSNIENGSLNDVKDIFAYLIRSARNEYLMILRKEDRLQGETYKFKSINEKETEIDSFNESQDFEIIGTYQKDNLILTLATYLLPNDEDLIFIPLDQSPLNQSLNDSINHLLVKYTLDDSEFYISEFELEAYEIDGSIVISRPNKTIIFINIYRFKKWDQIVNTFHSLTSQSNSSRERFNSIYIPLSEFISFAETFTIKLKSLLLLSLSLYWINFLLQMKNQN